MFCLHNSRSHKEFDAFSQALTNVFSPVIFGVIVSGTILAVILGVIPGISAGLAIIVLLPFLFGTEPLMALCLLTALSAVGITGGSITAVLIGIPGDPSNAATILDGYPMTKKGE